MTIRKEDRDSKSNQDENSGQGSDTNDKNGIIGKDTDRYLHCHRCGSVYCKRCTQLSDEQYELVKIKGNSIDWYCQFCCIGLDSDVLHR